MSKVFFFKGNQYVQFDMTSNAVDLGPKPIESDWHNLVNPGAPVDFRSNIQAAVNWGNGKMYWFKDSWYVRINIANKTVDPGFPARIADGWPGLFTSGINAAVNWGNGFVYFFKGNEYSRFNIADDRVDPGWPKSIEEFWPRLFPSDIDAALNWGNGKVYFFKGSKYMRFDVPSDRAEAGYPAMILAEWPGVFASDIDAAVELVASGPIGPRCVPVFEPAFWNDDRFRSRDILVHNNCYDYASDLPHNLFSFAQPGRGGGNVFNADECAALDRGARLDGLVPVADPNNPSCAGCSHLVALVCDPGFDFHWYRRDADGTWSHKAGPSRCTNRDSAGNTITDPRTAARGRYTNFCGFYCVNRATVRVK